MYAGGRRFCKRLALGGDDEPVVARPVAILGLDAHFGVVDAGNGSEGAATLDFGIFHQLVPVGFPDVDIRGVVIFCLVFELERAFDIFDFDHVTIRARICFDQCEVEVGGSRGCRNSRCAFDETAFGRRGTRFGRSSWSGRGDGRARFGGRTRGRRGCGGSARRWSGEEATHEIGRRFEGGEPSDSQDADNDKASDKLFHMAYIIR